MPVFGSLQALSRGVLSGVTGSISVEQGQVVTLPLSVVDATGAAVTPNSITLTVQDPTGAQTVYTPPADAVGMYHLDLSPAVSGLWRYRWVTTGPGQGVLEGDINVRAPFSTVIGLADAREFLRMKSTTSDGKLQSYIDAAVSIVETRCGFLTPQVVTQTSYTGSASGVVVLWAWPVLALSTVTVSAYLGQVAVDDTATWQLDPVAGIVRRRVIGGTAGYYGPGSVVNVTYTSGRSQVPPELARAVLFVLKEMWDSQRGTSATPSSSEPAGGVYAGGAGFLVPDQALEAMLPYLKPPGHA